MTAPSASTLLNRLTAKAKFRHMLVLVKLAELGSMRRAASAVSMTQPAVSQLVMELESLLETQLFFRHARGVRPTEVTKELLPIARRALQALEDGAERISSRLQRQSGIVRVSASPAAINGLVQGAITSFPQRYPDVQIQIVESHSSDPLLAVSEDTADVILTREPQVVPKEWVFRSFMEDALIIVGGAGHGLAGRAEISPEELGQQTWLTNRVGSVARDYLEDMTQRYGWDGDRRCFVTAHIPDLTLRMLISGLYLAIIPRSVAQPWLNDGTAVQICPELSTTLPPLGAVYHSENTGSAASKFIAHVLEARAD